MVEGMISRRTVPRDSSITLRIRSMPIRRLGRPAFRLSLWVVL